MAPKRTSLSPKQVSRTKKSRVVDPVPVVLDVLRDSDALPADLRTLLQKTLPYAAKTDKVDRHAYENEVVDQTGAALAAVQASIEEAHSKALAKQEEVIAPAEREKRVAAKKDAEASLEALRATLEEKQARKAAAKDAAHEAKGAMSAAQKAATKVDAEMENNTKKKASLASLLTNELVLLKNGTSTTAEGKKAVKTLLAASKEYNFDDTLMQTFPVTCKKEPAARSEFEAMMFTSLHGYIEKKIDSLTQTLAEGEPVKADKLAAVAAAKDALEKAEAALAAVQDELTETQAAQKDVAKREKETSNLFNAIWADMKEACDAADELAQNVKNFKENILPKFEEIKEKAPEPEPVEAEPEAATELGTAAEPEAAAEVKAAIVDEGAPPAEAA